MHNLFMVQNLLNYFILNFRKKRMNENLETLKKIFKLTYFFLFSKVK